MVRQPRVADSLAAMGQVPDHVRAYMQGLSKITPTRADSFLDGLIGTNPAGSTNSNSFGGGWSNALTGLGTARDKVMAGVFNESIRIDDLTLTSLFNGNDIAKRIVSAKAKEMFRRGWVLAIPGGPNDVAQTMKDTKPMILGGTDLQGNAPKGPGNSSMQSKANPGSVAKMGNAPMSRGKARGDGMDPNAVPQGGPAKNPPPDPHEGQGESGPAAPSPEAVPGADPKTPPAGAPGDQNSQADIAKAAEVYAARLQHIPRLREATIFGNLYGGGVLIMGVDDGQDMSMPVNEDKIKSVRFLTWIDRRFVVAHTYYETIGPRYGEVEVYNIVNPFGNQSNQYVHESRVLRFEGEAVDLLMRRRLAGWTLSKLQAAVDAMRQFEQSFQSVSNLMSDISQAVMKIKGLAQMISNDPITLQTRMTMVDMSRSSARMVYLDAENEEFVRVATPLTGVAETLEMQMLRLSAAVEMPVAILFGREPSGLNATGDADFRRFYDMIAGDQKDILEPKLTRLYTLIFRAQDGPTKGVMPEGGLEFTWHKLYAPSELEQSTIRWNMAQADDKYIANGTLLPEEVAMSRFRSGDLHLDTEIQGDLRREKLKTAQLAPSGAEKAQKDQENKQAELEIKSKSADAKTAGPPAARGDSDDEGLMSGERCDSKTIKKILKELKDDYPQETLDWVKAARWRGPVRVPISQIDFRGRQGWVASQDGPESLKHHLAKIKAGDDKPILLIDTPDNTKYECIDGHHRLLAYEQLEKPVLAFVATVEHHEGPWDTMHQKQRSGPSKTGSIPPPPPEGSPPPAEQGG